MTEGIVYSVICVTYNHKKYIEKALGSILMQETGYLYEVIVHDDCSSDGSSDLIDKFALNHPDKVRVIRPVTNRYSKDGFAFVSDAIKLCKGKYIALLDGDDYWLDSSKIEDDVNFLQKRIDVSMLFSAAEQVNEGTGVKKIRNIYSDGKTFDLDYIIRTGGGFYPTSTSVFRREVFESIPSWFHSHATLDYPIAILAATKGAVTHRSGVTAVYHSHVASFSHAVDVDLFKHKSKLRYFYELNSDFFLKLKESGVISSKVYLECLQKEEYMYSAKLFEQCDYPFFSSFCLISSLNYKVKFLLKCMCRLF